jgi:organic radical activating enzyme
MAVIVKKEFLGIQGQGVHRGIPMYFVVLQHTTDGEAKPQAEKDIMDRIITSKSQWLCIIPATPEEEPYAQDLDRLAALAFANSIRIFIQTSGTIIQHVYVDWICLVPKIDGRIELEFKKISDEIRCDIRKLEDIDYYIKNYYNPKIPLILNCISLETFGDTTSKILEKVAGMNNVRVMLI